MKTKDLLMTMSLSAFLVTACAGGVESGGSRQISGVAIVAGPGTPEQKAEELALSAEALADAEGFQQADDMAELALQQDPQNFRARLIRAVAAPVLLLKGMAVRLEPVARKEAQFDVDLKKMIADLSVHAIGTNTNSFVLDGTPDLQTEADAQKRMDAIIQSLVDLRSFLKDARSQEITIQIPTSFTEQFTKRYAHACQIKVNAKYEYDLICPPNSTRTSVTLNRADFEYLNDGVTYYLVQFIIPNAYDLTNGLPALLKKARDPSSSSQDLVDALSAAPGFGRLRSAEHLKLIRAMGVDLIASVRWAMANQSQLCPTGTSTAHDRLGMLFNEGLCVPPSSFTPYVDGIAPAASDVAQNMVASNGDKTYETKVNWTALANQPIADLHQLGPLKFDTGNSLIFVTEPTAGGTFPGGDVNSFLNVKDAALRFK